MDERRKLIKTEHPGIFRRGVPTPGEKQRYVVTWYADGKQHRETVRGIQAAKALKATRKTDQLRGEFFEASRLTFAEYAAEWVERYQGRRGFRESTRDNYRADLRRYGIPCLGKKQLGKIQPRDIANFYAWLCDERAQAKHEDALRAENGLRALRTPTKRFSESAIQNIAKPVKACFKAAANEGLIRMDPTRDISLPHREEVEEVNEDQQRGKGLTRDQLAMVLRVVPAKHRLLFEFMAATGLRIGETLALEWRHLKLDGGAPYVRVRQQWYRARIQVLKTKKSRRDVPITLALADQLRARREQAADDSPVFTNKRGTFYNRTTLSRATLDVVRAEADIPWLTFHTLRHTCASMLFERGRNLVQVQHWLGHSSPDITLRTYLHMLDDELPEPLDMAIEIGETDNEWTMRAGNGQEVAVPPDPAEIAL